MIPTFPHPLLQPSIWRNILLEELKSSVDVFTYSLVSGRYYSCQYLTKSCFLQGDCCSLHSAHPPTTETQKQSNHTCHKINLQFLLIWTAMEYVTWWVSEYSQRKDFSLKNKLTLWDFLLCHASMGWFWRLTLSSTFTSTTIRHLTEDRKMVTKVPSL